MANKGKGGNFEWLVIRVETIYKILVVAVVLLAGGLGWYFYKKSLGTNSEKDAQECVGKAEAALEKAKRGMDAQRMSLLGPVYNDLAVARDALKNKEFAAVCPAANKVLAGVSVLTNTTTDTPQAIVDDLSGTVMVKKSASPDYITMNRGMALSEGDIIRTSSGSEALIRYPDGTKQNIGPDTIYQIRTLSRTEKGLSIKSFVEKGSASFDRPATSSKDNNFNLATAQDVNAALQPGTRGAITENPDTKTTDIAIFQGTGTVTHNNQTQELSAGSKGTITAGSAPMVLTELPKQPTLIIPADMQVITTAPDESRIVVFQWSSPTGKHPYQFQIGADPFLSKDRLLTEQSDLKESTLSLKLPPGSNTYYWRVREADPKAPAGEGGIGRYIWSYTYAFKVIAQLKPVSGSGPAPDLTLLCKLFQFSGDTVLVTCEVTPGLTVTINEQEVDVSEGRCQKMVSFNQPGIHNILVRAFDNYGNEKKQTLVYKATFQ